MNTEASILVYKFRPERTGLNMFAEYTRPQLTFLALVPCRRSSDSKSTYFYEFLHYFFKTRKAQVPFREKPHTI